jgi:hypothetical protein
LQIFPTTHILANQLHNNIYFDWNISLFLVLSCRHRSLMEPSIPIRGASYPPECTRSLQLHLLPDSAVHAHTMVTAINYGRFPARPSLAIGSRRIFNVVEEHFRPAGGAGRRGSGNERAKG